MCLKEISFPVLYRPTCPGLTEPSHWLRGAEIESRLAPRLLLYPIPTTAARVCEKGGGFCAAALTQTSHMGKSFMSFPPLFLSPLICCDMWVRMPQPQNDDDDDMPGENNNKLALALLLLLFSVARRGICSIAAHRFPHSSHFFPRLFRSAS